MVAHTGYLVFARPVDSPFGQVIGHGSGKSVWPSDGFEDSDTEEE